MTRSPLLALGLLTCSIPALVAGCGGGGGGGSSATNPTSTPRPTPTTTPVSGNCDNSTYSPNYAAAAGMLQHWEGFPLRVFLGATDSRTRALTLRGFNQWVTATNNKVRYEIVNTSGSADISVSFNQFEAGGENLGVTTTYYFEGQSTIERAEIVFYYYPTDSRSDADEVNQSVAAHEFGHALCIGGHSPARDDMMFPSATGGLEEVTTRDLNTLLTAYCNDFPARSNAIRKKDGVLRKRVISDKK